ncbi:MAG: CRISPR-associated protein Cas4 [Proteobacteria bacterium]|nr:CRISPR-associated protein Cas4 [Pseudomonadota bacterium]
MSNPLHYTGTQINYYFLCHRKLWYFMRHISMEQNSDLVYLGKVIHESSYDRESKEIDIDDTIKIDFVDKEGVIHEVKKSKKVEEPNIWQVKYYIWYLKQKGVGDITGKINYPKLRKTLEVFLEPGDEEKIMTMLEDIKTISQMDLPPAAEKKKICRSCSYNDLCWI